jgi:hypothetical protein
VDGALLVAHVNRAGGRRACLERTEAPLERSFAEVTRDRARLHRCSDVRDEDESVAAELRT